VLLQVVQIVNAAFRLVLLALYPALSFVPLFLLARLFFLALRKCRSASWHIQSPNLDSFSSVLIEKTLSKLVRQADGPASDITGLTILTQAENAEPAKLSPQTFSRKIYQRGSRGWRA
jgi:hypothetical protein